MYDTIVIKSPEINQDCVTDLLKFCTLAEGLDICTGELLYTFTSGMLDGSYDYRIRFKVDNTEWVKEDNQIPVRVESYWHIVVECSLHKIMMNHNVYGGPCNIHGSVKYLVNLLEELSGVMLPNYLDWQVKRIDVSKIFKFHHKDICKKITNNLANTYFSRRKAIMHDTSIMFPGSTTTCKIYWKGPEFKKHDYKRVIRYINRELDLNWNKDNCDLLQHRLALLKMRFDKLQALADRIIRFECEIKERKLRDLFGKEDGVVLVSDLKDDILHQVRDEQLFKVMKESDEMDIVRRSDLVLERLHDVYGFSLGNNLYSTWAQLVQFGEKVVKGTMSKTTFYRHRKLLIESGCSWFVSTLKLQQFSIVPEDFSFGNNLYADETEADEVIKALQSVA